MKLKITILSICLFMIGNMTMAQTSTPESTGSAASSNYGLPKLKDFDRFSAGISFGVNYFQADIEKNSKNNNSILHLPNDLMYGANINYQLTHTVGIRLGGMLGKLTAENHEFIPQLDTAQYVYYSTNVTEGTLEAVFTIGNVSFLQRNKKFHLYGVLGAGIFNYDGELKDSGATQKVIYKTGNIAEGMLTAGFGFKYQVGKRMDLGIGYSFRKTFTDKVDGLEFPTTETDNYSFLALNLNYTFGKKEQQLEWVNPMEIVYNDMAELKDKMDVLSGDKDKDGVSDMFDKDNATPEGTKVYGDGTSMDVDGDGVPDNKDTDLFSTKGAKVDANGVEIDTDGDGVPDGRDLEPSTPKGSLTNFQGIAIDKALAATAGTSSSVVSGWFPPIFFELNKAEIRGIQRDRVVIIAKVMKNNPDLKVKIIGNADITGGESYNDKLALKRADAVKNHLVKYYGIDASRITTESKGEKDPLAKNLNPMNRRADFEIQK
jgi:outer membrane protein OmpA-like peptidoglycan-associated protein